MVAATRRRWRCFRLLISGCRRHGFGNTHVFLYCLVVAPSTCRLQIAFTGHAMRIFPFTWMSLLFHRADAEYTATRLARKENFQLKCIEFGLCSSDASTWHRNGVVANCSDTADGPWGHVFFRQHPTVCRSSRFYNVALDRPVLLQELWMVNGFPHPAAAQLLPATKTDFPFPSLVMHDDVKGVGKLSDSEQRHLIGNCMHVAAIGSICLQHVASVAR